MQDPELDPLVRGMEPRVRTKMSRIPNTAVHKTYLRCDGAGPGLLPKQVHHVGGELAAGLVILLQLLTKQNYMLK